MGASNNPSSATDPDEIILVDELDRPIGYAPKLPPHQNGGRLSSRLVVIPPMGTHLLDVASLAGAPARGTAVLRLRLEGNAWFNLYLVGAGPRDLLGPLSLMHVK